MADEQPVTSNAPDGQRDNSSSQVYQVLINLVDDDNDSYSRVPGGRRKKQLRGKQSKNNRHVSSASSDYTSGNRAKDYREIIAWLIRPSSMGRSVLSSCYEQVLLMSGQGNFDSDVKHLTTWNVFNEWMDRHDYPSRELDALFSAKPTLVLSSDELCDKLMYTIRATFYKLKPYMTLHTLSFNNFSWFFTHWTSIPNIFQVDGLHSVIPINSSVLAAAKSALQTIRQARSKKKFVPKFDESAIDRFNQEVYVEFGGVRTYEWPASELFEDPVVPHNALIDQLCRTAYLLESKFFSLGNSTDQQRYVRLAKRKEKFFQLVSKLLCTLWYAMNYMPATAIADADRLMDFLCGVSSKKTTLSGRTGALRTGFMYGNYEGRCALKHIVAYGIDLYHDLILRQEKKKRVQLQYLASYQSLIIPGGEDYAKFEVDKISLDTITLGRTFLLNEVMDMGKIRKNMQNEAVYLGKNCVVNLTKRTVSGANVLTLFRIIPGKKVTVQLVVLPGVPRALSERTQPLSINDEYLIHQVDTDGIYMYKALFNPNPQQLYVSLRPEVCFNYMQDVQLYSLMYQQLSEMRAVLKIHSAFSFTQPGSDFELAAKALQQLNMTSSVVVYSMHIDQLEFNIRQRNSLAWELKPRLFEDNSEDVQMLTRSDQQAALQEKHFLSSWEMFDLVDNVLTAQQVLSLRLVLLAWRVALYQTAKGPITAKTSLPDYYKGQRFLSENLDQVPAGLLMKMFKSVQELLDWRSLKEVDVDAELKEAQVRSSEHAFGQAESDGDGDVDMTKEHTAEIPSLQLPVANQIYAPASAIPAATSHQVDTNGNTEMEDQQQRAKSPVASILGKRTHACDIHSVFNSAGNITDVTDLSDLELQRLVNQFAEHALDSISITFSSYRMLRKSPDQKLVYQMKVLSKHWRLSLLAVIVRKEFGMKVTDEVPVLQIALDQFLKLKGFDNDGQLVDYLKGLDTKKTT